MSKMAIVYWSGTGNTEAMAKGIAQGAEEAGAQVALLTAEQFSAEQADEYEKIAFGCPSMGSEELEDAVFEPMFTTVESKLKDKQIALFGSYGWGDGEWMRTWQERCISDGAKVYGQEGLMVNGEPTDEAITACKAFGGGFANS